MRAAAAVAAPTTRHARRCDSRRPRVGNGAPGLPSVWDPLDHGTRPSHGLINDRSEAPRNRAENKGQRKRPTFAYVAKMVLPLRSRGRDRCLSAGFDALYRTRNRSARPARTRGVETFGIPARHDHGILSPAYFRFLHEYARDVLTFAVDPSLRTRQWGINV